MTKIKFPITVNSIKCEDFGIKQSVFGYKTGNWVAVRVCNDSLKNKTFLGVYLSDLSIGAIVSFNQKNRKLTISDYSNPIIYIPDIKQLFMGCESWWKKIESPEDLKSITNADIENIWYVRALKELSEKA